MFGKNFQKLGGLFGDRSTRAAMGLQMMAAPNNQAAFAAMGQGMAFNAQQQQELAERAKKIQYLKSLSNTNPQTVAAVEAGVIDPAQAYQSMTTPVQAPKPTSAIQNYQFAKQQGFEGSFMDFQIAQKRAGADNITLNSGAKYGPISKDHRLIEGDEGVYMEAIPGSPADKAALQAGQRDVETNTIVSAAQDAREAAGDRAFGGVGQGVVQMMPWTDSAEVARKVDVLKAQASVGNLNQMRQSSPTGGALGNVTERELKLLQDKSGALDPSSPNFADDLNDYELTLLQTIHGPEAGLQIYNATRKDVATPQESGGQQTSTGVNWSFK